MYIATAREVQYDLSDGARQRLVDEFVQMRKKDPAFGEHGKGDCLILKQSYGKTVRMLSKAVQAVQ